METEKTGVAGAAHTLPVIVEPKEGVETSSYRLLMRMIFVTVAVPLTTLVLAVPVAKGWIGGELEATIRYALVEMLVGVGIAIGGVGTLGTAYVGKEYVAQRGELSRVRTVAAVAAETGTSAESLSPPQPGVSVKTGNIERG